MTGESKTAAEEETKTSSVEDTLAEEAAELDGYFSDAPLDIQPVYPPLRDSLDSSIIIANLPKVPQSKVEKLTKVIVKLVSKIGTLAVCDETGFNGVYMPVVESKVGDDTSVQTLGFCFIDYETPEEAKHAEEVLQGYKFDKKHTLLVMIATRGQKLQKLQSTTSFPSPPQEPFVEKPNAMSWLEDPNQRDCFVIRQQRETVTYWFDGKNDPVIDYDGAREKEAGVAWCEYYCHWSPKGSYLATLVPAKGVILWSGATYEKSGRFVAPDVKMVLFSPQENFLLTNNERRDDPQAIKIYHIPTGNLLRTFSLYPEKFNQKSSSSGKGGTAAAGMTSNSAMDDHADSNTSSSNVPPPPFLWSHDDQYLARMGDGLISIFETPTMKLLDKRSLAAPGIHEFQWSPKANIIAYWAPEQLNSPAHVDLIEIPTRKKLRQKNLFNVTKCNMVWQNEGEYLAVKVTRHTKSKKTLYNNIELFRLNDSSGIPVEMLDMKDAVMALAWEPRGSRFAMIHAENPSSTKVNVSFYNMMKKSNPSNTNTNKSQGNTSNTSNNATVGASSKSSANASANNASNDGTSEIPELNKIETLQGRQCTGIFWSPAGRHCIMASLGDSASGTLEFYDLDSKTMVVKEHYRANQVLWDPSGRSATTVVSQPIEGGHFKFAMDNGYIIWSFQGKQLYQQSYEAFYQFCWRPRENLLSKDQIRTVQKQLKKYEKQFDKADKERQRALYLEETKGKRLQRSKYRSILQRNRAIFQRRRQEYIDLLNGYDSDDETNYRTREVSVETVLSSKEELVM